MQAYEVLDNEGIIHYIGIDKQAALDCYHRVGEEMPLGEASKRNLCILERTIKPMFIPLKSEHYEAFENRNKRHERRLYGKRWNKQTCIIGREVILSKGYGKKHRLKGVIVSYGAYHISKYQEPTYSILSNLYGQKLGDNFISEIGIEVVQNG